MHRFFVSGDIIKAGRVTLTGDQAHQIRNVLRMAAGDWIVVLDNEGWEYEVVLQEVGGKEIRGQVRQRRAAGGEPRTQITLYQSLLQRDKFEWVLQKCTEVGVTRFVPLVTRRSLVRDTAVKASKLARWRRILTEAAEQSRRGRIPELMPALKMPQALAGLDAFDCVLLAWAGGEGQGIGPTLAQNVSPPTSVALFIGPEGGFVEEEVADGRQHGAIPISLGRRILRTETAAVVATSLILHELGDLV